LKFELGPLDGKSKIGVVDANRFLHAHCGGNGASVVVAGKVVRKVKEEEKRLRRWAGWHWYVFALHSEARYSYIF
jgi:hypothetical protein